MLVSRYDTFGRIGGPDLGIFGQTGVKPSYTQVFPAALLGKASPRVTILLATYNGAAHLAAQLDSFCTQTLVPAHLIVSDDGSTDSTRTILRDFAARDTGFTVALQNGPRRGAGQNFLALLRGLPDDTEYVAFSDQDDVWLPEKIARGARLLAQLPEATPALLGGRSYVCNADLGIQRLSPVPRRELGLRHALVQNFAGGNTMMLNRAAIDLARDAAAEAGRVVVHDWWLYQLIAGVGGTVIYDPEPGLLYRQHASNQIGANCGLRAKAKRLHWMLKGRFRRWNAINLAALRASSHRITPENRVLLKGFEQLQRAGLWDRLSTLRQLGLYRQGLEGTLSLWLAAILGRL